MQNILAAITSKTTDLNSALAVNYLPTLVTQVSISAVGKKAHEESLISVFVDDSKNVLAFLQNIYNYIEKPLPTNIYRVDISTQSMTEIQVTIRYNNEHHSFILRDTQKHFKDYIDKQPVFIQETIKNGFSEMEVICFSMFLDKERFQEYSNRSTIKIK
jgi:hypothetical protein